MTTSTTDVSAPAMAAVVRELRPHQQRAIDDLKASILAGRSRPVVQAPTGAGKTRLAAEIVNGARRKGKRLAFCVPALSLIEQTFRSFSADGVPPADMGVIQGDHPWRRPHAPIQICSAQTLSRRDLPEVDIVVIDECHVRFKVYDGWIKGATSGRPIFIGLSATPWSRGLGKLFDDLIRPTSIGELIEAGYLSPFRVFAPTHPDLEGVKIRNGDYAEEELSKRMDQPELVADVVNTWLAKAKGMPTLCFATGRAHAKNLHDRFASAGVRVAYVDANTPREERDEIGRRLGAGDLDVVCNIGCLTTGVDWDVRCISLCRPTKSDALMVQIIGRGLRTANGKDHCLILDHSDNHLRLGFVTDIEARHDELDTGRDPKEAKKSQTERKDPLPKECTACGCLIPAIAPQCPSCGHTVPLPQFREGEGQLIEMRPGEARTGPQQWRKRKGETSATALLRMGPAACWQQIRWVQEQRGRKRGWAARKFKDLIGDWPARSIEHLEPVEACSLMVSWIRSRDIAWARARRSADDVEVAA